MVLQRRRLKRSENAWQAHHGTDMPGDASRGAGRPLRLRRRHWLSCSARRPRKGVSLTSAADCEAHDHADTPHSIALFCERGDRPHCRTAQQRDERATPNLTLAFLQPATPYSGYHALRTVPCGSKAEVGVPNREVCFAPDCVAKLPLMRIANHDSVGGDGIGGSGA
jgi:hypothetical protein